VIHTAHALLLVHLVAPHSTCHTAGVRIFRRSYPVDDLREVLAKRVNDAQVGIQELQVRYEMIYSYPS